MCFFLTDGGDHGAAVEEGIASGNGGAADANGNASMQDLRVSLPEWSLHQTGSLL